MVHLKTTVFLSHNCGGERPFLLWIRPFSFARLWWGTAVSVVVGNGRFLR
ncbi:MAG: hypothetical protein HND44_17270 [Chloroflexi bacterium]|nr:hypothetical protein [Ardenticatenaceae bacterium]NOG36296.1 hypothetical protein [Chloroflexota bacterium]